MRFPLKRRAAILTALGAALLAGGGLYLKLRGDVRAAFAAPVKASAPLRFLPVPEPAAKVERWGGGDVVGVAVTPDALITAGASGVRDGQGDAPAALPTLRVSAMALWRGEPVAALEAGRLFLRRSGHWEELSTGFGILHVRALLESPGGELLIGAREGLYKAAWGASVMDRLDAAPVQAIALTGSGAIFEGGETGLRRVEPGRVQAVPSPDPWIQWVGVQGDQLAVLTPLGLARGPVGGALAPVAGCESADSAVSVDGKLYVTAEGRLLSLDEAGRPSELFLPSKPERVMATEGNLFVDTEQGLYRRAEGKWELARPRPASLPGSSHVGALAFLDAKLVVGLFDQGVVVGDPAAPGWNWRAVQGSSAWGVNALLPSGGGLYVASLRGASRFDGQRLVPVVVGSGGGAGAAFSLAETGSGVAIGYGQGVALPDARFLSAFHGLPGNQALALAQEPGGLLFVGTPTGLGAIRGSRVAWRVTSADGKLPNAWVNALARFNGALYIGTYGGGVAKREASPVDGSAVGTFDAFPETAGFKVSEGCLVAAGGTLYLGTDGLGLYRLGADGKRFEPVRIPLPSPHITAILPSKDSLFIGTDEGLARVPFPLPGEGG